MKKVKITVTIISLILVLFLLASCSLTSVFGNIGITIPETKPETLPSADSSSAGTGESGDEAPDPIPDLSGLDFSEYISLDYKGMKLTVSSIPTDPTEAEIDEELLEICTYYGFYGLITDRATAEGDWIEMSFEGSLDGVVQENMTSDKATILLDEENSGYIPGFAAGIIGTKPGESVTLNLTFPTDYHQPTVAGKEAVFIVTVKGICTGELTDAQVAELTGDTYKTYAEFREYVRVSIKEGAEDALFDEVAGTIEENMINSAEIKKIPDVSFNYYNDFFTSDVASAADYAGQTVEEYMAENNITADLIKETAEESAKIDLIIAYVAHNEGITVTDEEYKTYKDTIAASYGVTGDYLENYYDSAYGAGYLRSTLLEKKVVEKVLSYADLSVNAEVPANNE